ncbi:MAG: His-Xaa-Ser system protein HxsD [Nanoarchaeota archaeon]|nr:His-Xaa-Ser system protein HxsD [Nanoarchaeota archaeon]MBU1854165.1 His-Xaa-Ser system protein HxsD [Nanoarchaeota archaeon]
MSEEDSILDNIEIHKDFAIISVNPKLYPLSVIYSAAYWLLDRVHVIIDGDPDTEILVEIRPKKELKVDLKEIGYEFNDELINYSVYTVQATRNKKLREMIVENALAGNLRNSPPPRQQVPQQNMTERCDCLPNNLQRQQPLGQMSGSWKPGEQPLQERDLQKIKDKESPTKNDVLFKGIPGVDTEGITQVKDYRHKTDDFSRLQ